jgi:NAD(P)-dependent dehydrogenase (short-subunit alcohol dehydrogenase family)
MKQFRDRVAVVTGAASGIGLALAERFASEGMKVVMADIEGPALTTAADGVRRTAGAVLAVEVDVSRPDHVERLAEETYQAFGAAHVLCNNAGVAVIGAVHEHSLADWHWVINVNLWGVIHGVRAFVPRMLAGGDEGHIVNTASMAGLTTSPFMSVYDVTKHGVVALSESMYKEFVVIGAPIGVSVVCPGLINTNIMRSARNRPAELAEEGKAGPMAQTFGQGLADRLATGYPPSEVAVQVFQGIRDSRFYIVPAQPDVKSYIAVRAQDLLELRNPTLRRV